MFVTNFLGTLLFLIGVAAFILALMSLRVANQYERSVIFRLGKFNRTAGPGLYFIWPFIEWLTKLALDDCANHRKRQRRHVLEQLIQLAGDFGRHDIKAQCQKLTELDVRQSQFFECMMDAHAE